MITRKYDDDVLLIASGGGMMSVECLTGVMKAFEESGIIPGRVISNSGGALFSSLYYSNKDSSWFEKLMLETKVSDWISPMPYHAIKTLAGKSNVALENINVKNLLFSELSTDATKRVVVTVTNLEDYSTHYKPATPTWTLASTSIPFAMRPVKTVGSLWGDGGIFNNIPMPPMDELYKWKHVFLFITPSTKCTNEMSGISGIVTMINMVFDREFAQIKESGYLKLKNLTLIQPTSDHGGNLLKWSDNFEMKNECYNITRQKLEAMSWAK